MSAEQTDPFRDVEEDGLTTPLVWQPGISGEDHVVVPIGLRTARCPSDPCFEHYHFMYLSPPGLLDLILGCPSLATATRYHTCLN